MRVGLTAACAAATIALLLTADVTSGRDDKKPAFDQKTYHAVTAKAQAYLKTRQAKDGSWSKATSPGITGLVVTGLLRGGQAKAADDVVANGLKFIESMIDGKEGHLAVPPPGAKAFQKNYITAVNMIALEASGQEKYKGVLAKAAKYLKTLQWDEQQEQTAKDAFYGGVGYAAKVRPDLSNSLYYCDALKAAGVPATDPTFKKLLVFVSRCQNLKGEHNDQPWADKIDDGSFIYVLGGGKGNEAKKDEKRPGYGSMTFSGLKLLSDCGVPKDDTRRKKAFEWASKNFTVEANPGMPEEGKDRGYYAYVAVMARCLAALGVDELTDAGGKTRDWRAELLQALAKRQRKDGSWSNSSDRWMEANPDLCTAYALIALSQCKPKAK